MPSVDDQVIIWEAAVEALLLQVAKSLRELMINPQYINRFDNGLLLQRRITDLEMLIGKQP